MANDFEAWSADELYLLHLEVATVLRKKLVAKKNALEERLEQLHRPDAHAPRPSNGKSKIPESRATVRNLVGTWQAALLARRAVEIWQTDRRLSN